MQAFVPRNRRPKFQLRLRILDLNNVPLVSGTSYIKWDLPHSAAAEHRGRTSKCHIKDHKVFYNYDKTVPVRLVVDKSNILQETPIRFEVVQEYSASSRGERIVLGNVKLNLAEYVDPSEYDAEENDEGVCRRYLMQDSKINSTLKIGIHMKLLEGERSFVAPSLKTAPVFGGIAGIISGAGEQGEADDPGVVPSLTGKSREVGEAQDLYRRNLAAFWTAQPGELRADDCIEDIFAGGDGWGKPGAQPEESPRKKLISRENAKDRPDWPPPPQPPSSQPKSSYHERHYSREFAKGGDSSPRSSDMKTSRGEDGYVVPSGVGGRGSLEQHANEMKAEAASRTSNDSHEVDEFDIREDLKSWKLPEAVS